MNTLRTFLFTLGFAILLNFGLSTWTPVCAQDEGAASLEDLMGEVDDELAEERAEEPEKSENSAKGEVESLEDMMKDLDANEGIDSMAIAKAPTLHDEESEIEDVEESELPGYFWFGLIAIIVLMILLGEPLFILIGSITMYLLIVGGVFTEFRFLTAIIEQTRGLADQPVLLAIPFFVISGAIMTEGDIAKRLIAFAESIFGWLPGGLAIAAVFACVFFAAISGSSPVTVIAIGSIMYPALIKRNYPEKFSAGLVTSAGSLGILIPPSIPMIIYAIVDPTGLKDPVGYTLSVTGGGDAGVKDLFLAGMGPGILIGLVFAIYAMKIGHKHKVATTPFSFKEMITKFTKGFWALNLPIIILGGIYSGAFTATQAAAVAVVYAAFVEFFIHRSITIGDVPRIFRESAVLMGSLLIIMALALSFNLYLDRAKIPEAAVEWIVSMNLSIIAFLLIVNILLLIVGFFMDIMSAILILVPLLAPIAFSLGIHPLHLAIVFIVNLEIGYLTPPIGLNLFVSSTLFKKGIGTIVKAVTPFVLLMMVCLALVTYVPTLSLGLVSVSKGQGFYVPFPTGEEKAIEKKGEKIENIKKKSSEIEVPKSLDDLMNEVDADDGAKSLEDLMNEVDDEME